MNSSNKNRDIKIQSLFIPELKDILNVFKNSLSSNFKQVNIIIYLLFIIIFFLLYSNFYYLIIG